MLVVLLVPVVVPRVTSSTDENTGLDDHGVGFDPSLSVDLLIC